MSYNYQNFLLSYIRDQKGETKWQNLKNSSQNFGLLYSGVENIDVGVSVDLENDDITTSKIEVFGKLKQKDCIFKGGLDNSLNTRLWSQFHVGKLTIQTSLGCNLESLLSKDDCEVGFMGAPFNLGMKVKLSD